MFLQYGNYVHATNEAEVTISRLPTYNDGGLLQGYLETWRIRGILQAADQTALSIAINQLNAAYAVQDRNLGLFFDSGAATSHVLLSAQSIGGVRVIDGPNYPVGTGAEYSTFRSYEIAVEAEFRNAQRGLLAWTESLSFSGGGPRFVMQQPLDGLPVRQRVAESTPYLVQQSGSAVGNLTYPIPSAPLFPADEHVDQRRIDRGQPRRHGSSYSEWPISWSYSFEAAAPLLGLPRTWPNN